jgi:PhzF family phenazine biosynthesis protein
MNVEVLRYAAFTDDPASGNPAGVVVDAGQLTEQDMLDIAAGVGYSETAFVTESDPQRRRYTVRYFSPRAEVPFCGHATIATAVEIARSAGAGELVFTTRAGEVPVHTVIQDGRLWATLTSVPARSRPARPDEVGPALAALGWAPGDLDPSFPVHVAFAGAHHLMLAAATRARLADLDYNFAALAELMSAQDWTTVHLFWAEEPALFRARDPFPPGGVVEDPATGAAAAAFGGYLRALGHITAPTRLTVRQGEDLGRPSELLVDVDPADERVKVTGQAVPIPKP